LKCLNIVNFKKSIHGDWGLGIGDWAQSPIPNPQSPIPNPQSPFISHLYISVKVIKFYKKILNNYLLMSSKTNNPKYGIKEVIINYINLNNIIVKNKKFENI
jgi:hypothetical protein